MQGSDAPASRMTPSQCKCHSVPVAVMVPFRSHNLLCDPGPHSGLLVLGWGGRPIGWLLLCFALGTSLRAVVSAGERGITVGGVLAGERGGITGVSFYGRWDPSPETEVPL